MEFDWLPLTMFLVDCDGTACGSGKESGNTHIHSCQDNIEPVSLCIFRDGKRTAYVSIVEPIRPI